MEKPIPPRSPGRPKVKESYDPPRAAGRIGPIWDECKAQALADGESMTAFVTEAITRELARRRRRDARSELKASMHVEGCDCLDATAVSGGTVSDPRCG